MCLHDRSCVRDRSLQTPALFVIREIPKTSCRLLWSEDSNEYKKEIAQCNLRTHTRSRALTPSSNGQSTRLATAHANAGSPAERSFRANQVTSTRCIQRCNPHCLPFTRTMPSRMIHPNPKSSFYLLDTREARNSPPSSSSPQKKCRDRRTEAASAFVRCPSNRHLPTLGINDRASPGEFKSARLEGDLGRAQALQGADSEQRSPLSAVEVEAFGGETLILPPDETRPRAVA